MCATLARFCEHLNFYFFTMANKRELKKAIKMACGEIAGQCLMAEASGYTREKNLAMDTGTVSASGR